MWQTYVQLHKREAAGHPSIIDLNRWNYQHTVLSFVPAALEEIKTISRMVNET